MQIQKPSDLDLHCLQRQGIAGISRTRVNLFYALWQQQRLGSADASVKLDQEFICTSIWSSLTNDSVSEQWKLWSDVFVGCRGWSAQSDQGFRCLITIIWHCIMYQLRANTWMTLRMRGMKLNLDIPCYAYVIPTLQNNNYLVQFQNGLHTTRNQISWNSGTILFAQISKMNYFTHIFEVNMA